MSKKVIFILVSIVIVLIVILIWLIPYMGISGEFIMHLSDTNPQVDFTVGFAKVELVFENFYANVFYR